MKKNLNILIVDDAFFIRNLIKRAIGNKPSDEYNYKFEIAGEAVDGEEGLLLYEAFKPDVVTVDVNMPFLGGVDFIKKVQKINKNAKIIVISSSLDSKMKQEVSKLGAYYIQKPFQEAFLWTKLDEIANNILNSVIEETPLIANTPVKENTSNKNTVKLKDTDKLKDKKISSEIKKDEIKTEIKKKNNSNKKKSDDFSIIGSIPLDKLKNYKDKSNTAPKENNTKKVKNKKETPKKVEAPISKNPINDFVVGEGVSINSLRKKINSNTSTQKQTVHRETDNKKDLQSRSSNTNVTNVGKEDNCSINSLKQRVNKENKPYEHKSEEGRGEVIKHVDTVSSIKKDIPDTETKKDIHVKPKAIEVTSIKKEKDDINKNNDSLITPSNIANSPLTESDEVLIVEREEVKESEDVLPINTSNTQDEKIIDINEDSEANKDIDSNIEEYPTEEYNNEANSPIDNCEEEFLIIDEDLDEKDNDELLIIDDSSNSDTKDNFIIEDDLENDIEVKEEIEEDEDIEIVIEEDENIEIVIEEETEVEEISNEDFLSTNSKFDLNSDIPENNVENNNSTDISDATTSNEEPIFDELSILNNVKFNINEVLSANEETVEDDKRETKEDMFHEEHLDTKSLNLEENIPSDKQELNTNQISQEINLNSNDDFDFDFDESDESELYIDLENTDNSTIPVDSASDIGDSAYNLELNNSNDNYNTSSKQINQPRTSIAPPKDRRLQEIYSNKMEQNYNVKFEKEDTKSTEIPKKKVGFFARLFNRKNKNKK